MPPMIFSSVDLPVPFAADQTDAVLRSDQPVEIFEKVICGRNVCRRP